MCVTAAHVYLGGSESVGFAKLCLVQEGWRGDVAHLIGRASQTERIFSWRNDLLQRNNLWPKDLRSPRITHSCERQSLSSASFRSRLYPSTTPGRSPYYSPLNSRSFSPCRPPPPTTSSNVSSLDLVSLSPLSSGWSSDPGLVCLLLYILLHLLLHPETPFANMQ